MGRFTTWSRGERTRGLVAVLVAVVLAAFVGSAAAQSIEEGYVPGGDGVALNHQKHGDGPPDLIVTNQVSVAVPLSGLAGEWTVVFYDTRGRGLSTPIWDPALLGMDQEIADISAVHERYGGEPATVLGGSLWGGFAQLYAARHPGRVRASWWSTTPATWASSSTLSAASRSWTRSWRRSPDRRPVGASTGAIRRARARCRHGRYA